MTELSVNVNKLATLRNSRGKNLPDVRRLAEKILSLGVYGLTVHPRPDGRHIRTSDVWQLKKLMDEFYPEAEFNMEGYPSAPFLKFLTSVHPDQATLVPDPPEALTSSAGWDLVREERSLAPVLQLLKDAGIRTSLFIEPAVFSREQKEALLRLNPDRVELYTEAYADSFGTPECEQILRVYEDAARFARSHGMGVNAGHDLNQENLGHLVARIPEIAEVSIGHAIICEAIEEGLNNTISNYIRILRDAHAGSANVSRSHSPRA